jgi:hypothetical protein
MLPVIVAGMSPTMLEIGFVWLAHDYVLLAEPKLTLVQSHICSLLPS